VFFSSLCIFEGDQVNKVRFNGTTEVRRREEREREKEEKRKEKQNT